MTSPPLTRKRSFIVTLGLLTGLAALTVDISLPAIPAMVDALATTLPRGQQIVGVFMAGMACGQIPAGLFSYGETRIPFSNVKGNVWGLPALEEPRFVELRDRIFALD